MLHNDLCLLRSLIVKLAQIMSQRAGVVNMHLKVVMSVANSMTMLYKIFDGVVKEEHYGLALARVVNLPPDVHTFAEKVSAALVAQAESKKTSSQALAVAKRRKLVLSLREALKQAESSPMEGKVLLSWLRKLQEEFVRRMEQIESVVDTCEMKSIVDDGD